MELGGQRVSSYMEGKCGLRRGGRLGRELHDNWIPSFLSPQKRAVTGG